MNGWGRGAGCDFAEQPCIDPTTGTVAKSSQPYFCNQPLNHMTVHGCTEDFSRKAVCELVDYGADVDIESGGNSTDDASEQSLTIPEAFRYFDNAYGEALTASSRELESAKRGYVDSGTADPSKHVWGGTDPDSEYCPYYRGFSNGLCNSPETAKYLKTDDAEEFKDNSRCVVASLSRRMTGLCLPIACVVSDKSLRIKVDGVWKTCSYAGEKIEMWWNDRSYVVCPDPVRTCPTFYCTKNCLGTNGGVCDFSSGQCLCPVAPILSSGSYDDDASFNVTMLSCDTPRDAEDAQLSLQQGGPDGGQWVRMELSLSQYYVQDTTVLTDEGMTLIGSIRRFFSRASPLEAFTFCLAVVVLLFVTGWGLYVCYARVGRRMVCSFLSVRRDGQNRETSEKASEKAVVTAAMLLMLRTSSLLGKGVHDPRKVNPDTTSEGANACKGHDR